MELSNCPRCGRLFAKTYRDLCPTCLKDIEREYELCSEYLRKYRQSVMHELAEATGVSARQITQFIREGRISVYQAPNVTYTCEMCNNQIREGHMCDSCRSRLMKDIADVKQESGAPPKAQGQHGAYRAIDHSRD
ncbi:TIGR03826 family flagellar region protein [Paenibacillus sp. 481]|uniref:TIGR03826 family flagellar region protein n=1 Tax=Paenibacillus sp. 481 TaxID=2835869 RepID=UPI001E59850A|nr:TIGR03826 family flagellar region protein [Paenibacillus sp. 481]UHA75704.1 flagellar protein [Paenibacillus sp. 481]